MSLNLCIVQVHIIWDSFQEWGRPRNKEVANLLAQTGVFQDLLKGSPCKDIVRNLRCCVQIVIFSNLRVQILGSNGIYLRTKSCKVVFQKNCECKCSSCTNPNNTLVMPWFAQYHLTTYSHPIQASLEYWSLCRHEGPRKYQNRENFDMDLPATKIVF